MTHASDVNALYSAYQRGMMPTVDTTPADSRELTELRTEMAVMKAEICGLEKVASTLETENEQLARQLARQLILNGLLRARLKDQRASVGAITRVLLDTPFLDDAIALAPAYAATLHISAGRVLGDRLLARLSETCEAAK